jgi:hypothetical protein
VENTIVAEIWLDGALSHLQVSAPGFFRAPAMPSDPSLERGVFEPEATAAMGEAFDAACNGLCGAGEAELRELIAERIVAAASRGELCPVRLRAAGLGWIVLTQVPAAASL